MQILTNKSVLRVIAAQDGGVLSEHMVSSRFLESYWRKNHVARVRKSISTLFRKGFLTFTEENSLRTYIATPSGRKWAGLKETL